MSGESKLRYWQYLALILKNEKRTQVTIFPARDGLNFGDLTMQKCCNFDTALFAVYAHQLFKKQIRKAGQFTEHSSRRANLIECATFQEVV